LLAGAHHAFLHCVVAFVEVVQVVRAATGIEAEIMGSTAWGEKSGEGEDHSPGKDFPLKRTTAIDDFRLFVIVRHGSFRAGWDEGFLIVDE
jgi:hypothetical protein